ncbi:MAG: acetyl-CoA synthase subunit delta, partial [Candidatus Methanoperedens sp.]|nr:acetyl-CoA synthase subunit delta [Candidatus Methanoperedens sp.]
LAGNDLFMMMHPTAVQVLKEISQTLYGSRESEPVNIDSWVSAVI